MAQSQSNITVKVRETIEKMISKAAVRKNKGEPFDIDLEKVQCYIDQQKVSCTKIFALFLTILAIPLTCPFQSLKKQSTLRTAQ